MSLQKRIEHLENATNPSRWITLIVAVDQVMSGAAYQNRCEAARLQAIADGRVKPNDKIFFLPRDVDADEIALRVLGRE